MWVANPTVKREPPSKFPPGSQPESHQYTPDRPTDRPTEPTDAHSTPLTHVIPNEHHPTPHIPVYHIDILHTMVWVVGFKHCRHRRYAPHPALARVLFRSPDEETRTLLYTFNVSSLYGRLSMCTYMRRGFIAVLLKPLYMYEGCWPSSHPTQKLIAKGRNGAI